MIVEENEVTVTRWSRTSVFNGTSVFTAIRIGSTVNLSIFFKLFEVWSWTNWSAVVRRKIFNSSAFLYTEKCLGGFAGGGELISIDDDELDSSFCLGGFVGGGVIANRLVDSYESPDNSFNWWSELSRNVDDGFDNDWTIGWCELINCWSLRLFSKDFFLEIVFFNGLTTACLNALANARACSGIIFDFRKRSPTRVGAGKEWWD